MTLTVLLALNLVGVFLNCYFIVKRIGVLWLSAVCGLVNLLACIAIVVAVAK